jgi:DNA-binding response OmpR family regulator
VTPSGSILIVDDDQDIREILRFILEAHDYRVDVAADGVEAWKHLMDSDPPALILLDLMMPRMDGEEFLKKLRASVFAAVPVVILSGNSAARKKAVELNAGGCLMKPVEFEELLSTVRRFMPGQWKKRDVA